ncbi:MAG: hypothetical protein FWC98_02790 [Bacteroidales bacterium]|nr:hypothetical protein [Bacteroidales bacterium]
MSENSTFQTQPESKEIDLIDITGKIFTGIGRGIRSLFAWFKELFLHFYRFTKQHFWILFVLAILGGGSGYFVDRKQDPFFESEMMVETQLVPRAQIVERINSLNLLVRDGNDALLARALNIPVSRAESILSIRADVVQVSADVEQRRADTIIEAIGPQLIRVRVRVSDRTTIEHLESAFVSFIENDPFTQERLAIFRTNNLLMQTAIETEIEQLRAFQRINIQRSPQVLVPGNMPMMVQHEERTYVSEILSLQSRLFNLQRDLALTRPLSVIQPFFAFETPVSRTQVSIMLFALLAVAAGYVVLLIRKNWKHL